MQFVQKKSVPTFSDHTAYHLHNFFDDMRALRKKYNTYAHGDPNAYQKTLTQLHVEDIDMMVRCVKNISDAKLKAENMTIKFEYQEGGLMGYEGFKPIYFLDPDYRKQRHQQLLQVVLEDEAKYGTIYNFSNV
jgi:hypothetical protein